VSLCFKLCCLTESDVDSVFAFFLFVSVLDSLLVLGMACTTTGGSEFLSGERGKLGYQSPEIVAGDLYDGKAADCFALGVALFILLTGHPPFARAQKKGVNCF